MASGEGSTMRHFIFSTGHQIIRAIKSRRLRCAGYVITMALKILTGKRTGKRPLGILRHRWDSFLDHSKLASP